MKRNSKIVNINNIEKLEESVNTPKSDTSNSKSISLLMGSNVDLEYQKIRYKIIQNGSISKKQGSAVLIQSTWRMYKLKSVFKIFIQKYRILKYKIEFPYFAALALKSRIVGIDRKQLFEKLVSHSIWNPHVLYKNKYRPSSFQNFTNTEQFLCPTCISDKNMIRFVRLCYQTLLRRYLFEWIILTKKTNRKRRPFRLDSNARLEFGVEFNAFHMWFRYTKVKIFKRKEKSDRLRKARFTCFDEDPCSNISFISKEKHSTSQTSSSSDDSQFSISTYQRSYEKSQSPYFNSTAEVPTWPNYEVSVQTQRAREQKADLYREKTIKTNVIQSLSILRFHRKQKSDSIRTADLFYQRRNMGFAYLAWQSYIQNNNSRSNILRSILKSWFFIAKRKRHFQKLYNLFQERHKIYEARKLLSALIKNKKISKIQEVYLYSKLQVKHSLASWVIFTMMNDKNEAPLSLALHAWIQYLRKRKLWHNFVFLDLKNSQYEYLKQKGFYTIINREYSPVNASLISESFKGQTVQLAQQVKYSKDDQSPVYLLTSDHSVQEKLNKAKTSYERREIFFDAWSLMMSQCYDPSLFIRIAILNKIKKENEKGKKVRLIPERNWDAFRKAVRYLLQIDVGSPAKINKVLDLIERNAVKALFNRSRCLHRDNMLLEAFKSHNRAHELHHLNSSFSINDTFLIFSQIKEANNEIANSYQYEELISELDLSDPNERAFSDITGCSTPIPPVNYFLNSLRSDYKQFLSRSDITGITSFHLGNKHGNRSQVSLGVKTYSRLEQFNGKNELIPIHTHKKTSIIDKLQHQFPSFGRPGHPLERETNKEEHVHIIKLLGKEEEQEEEMEPEIIEEEDIDEEFF